MLRSPYLERLVWLVSDDSRRVTVSGCYNDDMLSQCLPGSVRCEENKAAQGEVPGMYYEVREDTETDGQRCYPKQITLPAKYHLRWSA